MTFLGCLAFLVIVLGAVYGSSLWGFRPFKLDADERLIVFRSSCACLLDFWTSRLYCNVYLTDNRIVLRVISVPKIAGYLGYMEFEYPLASIHSVRLGDHGSYNVRVQLAFADGDHVLWVRMKDPSAFLAFFHQFLLARDGDKSMAAGPL